MGNDLIFKIAVGVFLGMAAWTNRAELGNVAFYLAVICVAIYAVVNGYEAIATPIKENIKAKAIKKLVRELLEHDLIDSHHEGALCLGLENEFSDVDFNSLVHLLDDFKRDIRNGNDGSYFKSQISQLSFEIIENFKQKGSFKVN
jgi:mevalonate kinase